MDIYRMNTGNLAFVGDSVYDLYIRKMVISGGIERTDRANRAAVRYVKAPAQAKAIRTMFHELEEDEKDLVKRARNKKTASKAKNADIIDYKWATGMEALVGYLYLSGQEERLTEIMAKAVDIIGEIDEGE